jgi:TetR/AcrR family transcriptional regulator
VASTGQASPPAWAESTTLVTMREVPAEMAIKLRAAAETLLARYDDIQMADIANAAGVARSSLYYYFTNKDDILAFLLRTTLDQLGHATAAAANGPGDAPTRLGAVVRAQLEHLNRYPAASQQLIAHLGRAGRLADIAARINDGFEEPVRRLLTEGAAEGTLRPLADPDLGATALFGAVLVIGLRALIVQGRIDVEQVIQQIAPMFWQGIAPSADTPPPNLAGT